MHLRQVLINLLGNAVKFTQERVILLNCNLISTEDSSVTIRFEVIDTGIGISQGIQPRIFETFIQADEGTTRRYGDSGLGSTSGSGSTFWFDLSFHKQSTTNSTNQQPNIAKTRLLRISDNSPNQTNATNLISELGITAVDVDSIDKAMEIPDREPDSYYMILVDEVTNQRRLAEQINSIARNPRHTETLILMVQVDTDQVAKHLDREKRVFVAAEPLDKALFLNAMYATHIDSNELSEEISYAKLRAASTKLKILVAEDNPVNRIVIGRILDKIGHKHQLVENGKWPWRRYDIKPMTL